VRDGAGAAVVDHLVVAADDLGQAKVRQLRGAGRGGAKNRNFAPSSISTSDSR
jgi:hypothetical protein